MSYNGSGTFVINSTGQPVVTGTVISSSTFNAFTADIGTGLSTAITKNGQTTTTALIPFAFGISAAVSSSFAAGTVAAPSIYLATDTGTGFYRIGANNNGYSVSGTKLLDFSSALLAITGAATVSTTLGVTGATTLSSALTYGGVTLSNAVTGTGNMVLSASPTLTGTLSAAAISASGVVSTTARSMLVQPTTATNDGSYKVTNTGGTLFVGLDDSAAGAFGTAGNYGTVIYRPNGTGLAISRTSTVDLAISSAGVVNIPGGLNNTILGATTPAAATVTTLAASGAISVSGATGAASSSIYNSGNEFVIRAGTANKIRFAKTDNSGDMAEINATGTSITGTLGVTGNFTANTLTSLGPIVSGGATVTNYLGSDNGTDRNAVEIRQGRFNKDNLILSTNQTTSGRFFVVNENGTEKFTIGTGGNTSITGTLLVGAASQVSGERLNSTSTGASTRAAWLQSDHNPTYTVVVQNADTTGDNAFMQFGTEATFTGRGSISYNRTAGLTAYTTTSDYRLKEHVIDLPNALETVSKLKPRQFDWKETGNTTTGFIAHELAEVCPHAVTGEKDATEIIKYEISPAVPATQDEEGKELTAAVEAVMGEREVPRYQGIDTSFLVATLTAAIQELNSKFEEYKSTHP